MWKGCWKLLTDPNGFFNRKINQDIEWKTPLIIMAVLAVIGAISAYTVTMKIMGALPEEAAAFAGIGAVFGIIGAIIGIFSCGYCTVQCSTLYH